jgi:hypothetical protein
MPCALLGCALVLGGCGGGQLAGPSGATTTQAQASAPTAPPPATTSVPARRRRRPTPTHPVPQRTTTPSQPPPVTTTPPPTTTTSAAPPPPSGPATHAVDERASVTLVKAIGDLHYIQHGHVAGTLEGEMTLETKPSARGGLVTFTMDVDGGGQVSGRGVVTPNVSDPGKLKPITGTAVITGGTGRFAGISGHGLIVSGKAALDGSSGSVRLTGVVKY